MQTATYTHETNGTVDIYYPDSPCMVFNPCVFKVVADNVGKVGITIGGRTVYYQGYLQGRAHCDVREYLQDAFGTLKMGGDIDYTQPVKSSELGKTVSVDVDIYAEDGTKYHTFTISLFCLWGGTRVGEDFTQTRRVTWFKNFPFTVGLYCNQSTNISVGINGAPNTLTSVENEGFYNVLIDDAHGGTYMTIYDIMGTLAQSTFDNTFDLTFYYDGNGITQTLRVKIRLVDDDGEGIYLRWVDRHGYWNYHLFKEGDKTLTADSSGQHYRNDLEDWAYVNGWQKSSGHRQNLTRTDIQPVCAPLVDADTFDMLETLCTSPCVDMYLGKDSNDVPLWTSVTVEAGSYTRSVRDHLQDFVCNIVLPETPIQSL